MPITGIMVNQRPWRRCVMIGAEIAATACAIFAAGPGRQLQPDALRVEQGSSVGYTDRYPAFFQGQDLELTGLPAGWYLLVQTANPARRLREVDYSNNAASLLVRLSWPSGRVSAPRIQVLRTCDGSGTCASPT